MIFQIKLETHNQHDLTKMNLVEIKTFVEGEHWGGSMDGVIYREIKDHQYSISGEPGFVYLWMDSKKVPDKFKKFFIIWNRDYQLTKLGI